MKAFLIAVSYSVLVVWSARSALAQTPEVTVLQGALQGRIDSNGVSSFLGIPYAAAPVGALRWQAPRPPAPWTGLRTASAFGAACAQQPVVNLDNEDCLYLNVWTPTLSRQAHLPVMVWIHGGGFVLGSASLPTFDGSALAHRNVIVVTINYRLGLFGFFAHPELTRESPHHASGNYGLADQLAALRWVQDNIEAFGGDKHRVTIFGQSAGSVSVLDLMTSPLSAGLFQRAIAQSGTPLLVRGSVSLSNAERQGVAFGTLQGASSIEQLRAMAPDDLMRRWIAAHGSTRPNIDGWILPREPAKAFHEHREMPVALMTGIAAREALEKPSDDGISDLLHATFGADASNAATLYPITAAEDPVFGTVANMLATDLTFRCPASVLETWHAQHGAAVFAYQFEDTLPGQEAIRASHTSELPFVFGTMRYSMGGVDPPAATVQLSQLLMTYWSDFAKTGNPNGRGVPRWPRFTLKDRAYMHLSGSNLQPGRNLRGDACELYAKTVVPRILADEGTTDSPVVPTASASDASKSAHPWSAATTTLGDLMDNEATRAILQQHIAELIANPQIQAARGMTLKSLQPYIASLTDEKLAAIDAELAKLH